MKKLYFDVETTGLNPEKHGLIQFSGIIEIDGEIKEKFNFKIKPFDSDLIEESALNVNNISREELNLFTEPNFIKKDF
ncbi:MAG: exonuclease domain-containing protein [Candidatus ainarchaeum sp.]|nr:exonuclease domain-containing protein [Candidatus ainarchaeum sp.]MDD3976129.1 exonuclease domain-containing protein [Candidatus ainarchaeum sp.]